MAEFDTDDLGGIADLRFSRRKLLGTGTKMLAATAVLGGLGELLAACGSSGTAAGASKASGASGGPTTKSLVAQVFPTDLSADNSILGTFKSEYGIPASAITVPTDYFTVTETRFLGGTPPFDCLDFNPGYLKKFIDSGWIIPLDGLPGVAELKKDMFPAALQSLTGPDGKLYGLPYYTNVVTLFYNETILNRYGMKPATSWDDLLSQAAKLKRQGVPAPIAPLWTTDFNIIQQNFVTECITRGMDSQFSSSLDPLWDKNPVALDVLNFWHELQSQQLIPSDATTINHHQDAALMEAGQSVYMWYNNYTLKEINSAKASAAGQVRAAVMPGNGKSFTFTSPTYQSKRSNVAEAWKLTRFQSGTDASGNYTGPIQRVAIPNGTMVGYRSLASNPTIAKAWSAWATPADLALFNSQLDKSVGEGAVLNTSWYSQYVTIMVKALSQFVGGQASAKETLSSSASQVRAIAKG